MTGRPGVGKTTLFSRVVSELRRSYSTAGFVCPEVRESGTRIGFKVIDLMSGYEGWLAMSIDRLGSCRGPRIGRYCVLEDEVGRVMARTRASLPTASIIAIDEIGPMELNIKSSKEIIDLAISMDKPGIFVVHYRLAGEITSKLKSSGTNYKLYTVDPVNRDRLYSEILSLALRIVGGYKQI
ncbi:MAG: nucleoside-triphosphatase [Sulfolobales archaeon]